MEYKDLFDDVMYEKYDTTPLSDDNAFIQSVKERASKMEKKKIKFKKPAVIAASIAAAAALTVSVGAATNWDIVSLFVQQNKEMREENSQSYEYIAKFYPEYFEYIPEGASVDNTNSKREYEILEKITHTIENGVIDYKDWIINVTGYAYDGNRFEIAYDVTYKNGIDSYKLGEGPAFDVHLMKDNEYLFSGGSGQPVTKEGDTEKRKSYFSCKPIALNYNTAELVLFVYGKDIEYEEIASFDIDLTVHGELTLDLDTDISGKYTTGKALKVEHVRISPLGVTVNTAEMPDDDAASFEPYSMGGANYDPERDVPVYITYKDGTVLDSSSYGNSKSVNADMRDDGMIVKRVSMSARDNVIDVENIKSVQIYNEIIEL